ncbi:potassium transporter TrkH [Rhodobacteraceae bacterium 2CG4]|uniref:Trk system potassium uptake protein n=1 Tax=Halovulum marinum TaxID=2662447 RepID=A0A6L5Z266_9RHOB|nr:TrkH family potassium uptake protein [Halovulum marinum]MSU90094.1 potassium transporter TrkH [Halovulum marinum]
MIDVRPVGYVIGMLVAALGITMLLPLLADMIEARGEGATFAVAALVTVVSGGTMALACMSGRDPGLTLQQIFLLTTGTWLALPLFGALPFWIGAPGVSYTDAFFEAMSGFTTTGATVLVRLQDLPAGTLLWRGMMQWFGGVGMIVVALAFLPALRVGGMQIFRSEAFDTGGKILPRAGEIAVSISVIYLALTVACMIAYSWAGMAFLDALVHAMTTLATGGMANHDLSFGAYPAAAEYVGALFMIIASLPFVLYLYLMRGAAGPLLRDAQVRGFLLLLVIVVGMLTAWQFWQLDSLPEAAFRAALFNAVSIITGTGYASTDYQLWGGFAVATFFLIGLVGGCAGSTCCSVKIFRYQLLFAAIFTQVRRLQSPHGLFVLRYDRKPVGDDVINSVMAFFVMFYLSLAVLSVLLSLMGLDPVTAISGAAAALANIGPGLGQIIGPSGNYASLSPQVKWVLAFAMLLGRLELMSVFVLFSLAFWRR